VGGTGPEGTHASAFLRLLRSLPTAPLLLPPVVVNLLMLFLAYCRRISTSRVSTVVFRLSEWRSSAALFADIVFLSGAAIDVELDDATGTSPTDDAEEEAIEAVQDDDASDAAEENINCCLRSSAAAPPPLRAAAVLESSLFSMTWMLSSRTESRRQQRLDDDDGADLDVVQPMLVAIGANQFGSEKATDDVVAGSAYSIRKRRNWQVRSRVSRLL